MTPFDHDPVLGTEATDEEELLEDAAQEESAKVFENPEDLES